MNNIDEPAAFRLGIKTTNAAFRRDADGDWNDSVSRILYDVADAIAAGGRPRTRADLNGNTVCVIEYVKESPND